ncbi:hypothetical protein FIBSPDRAFT_949568 [Athelia psychrophila]|uniref:Uncharacterized protein n=1 Tax=Athelia psychrophila TaxID=1759441 RepID=A0A166PSA4_9AGAM|nr:hypothetical protein FIBSPDRAFT_949568 [Fibularhizoctonia sp. CBS 109695]
MDDSASAVTGLGKDICEGFVCTPTPTNGEKRKDQFRPSRATHPSCGIAFLSFAVPLVHEPVISKSVNSSFIGMRLEALLKERQVHRLFIQELSTDHHNQPEYVYDVPTQSRASSSDSQSWVLLIKEQVARIKDHEDYIIVKIPIVMRDKK